MGPLAPVSFNIRRSFDESMSEPVEGADVSLATRAVSATTRLRELWAGTSDRMESAGEYVHDAVEKPVRGFYGALHKSPGAVIVILL